MADEKDIEEIVQLFKNLLMRLLAEQRGGACHICGGKRAMEFSKASTSPFAPPASIGLCKECAAIVELGIQMHRKRNPGQLPDIEIAMSVPPSEKPN